MMLNKAKKLLDKAVIASDEAIQKTSKDLVKTITASRPLKTKKVFKNQQMVATIKEKTPAPYVPLYFKQELEQTKRSMFFE